MEINDTPLTPLEVILQTAAEDLPLFTAVFAGIELRSYQLAPARAIYEACLRETGGTFCVMFPRQSGKNEVQAQLETLLLLLSAEEGGEIIKVSPTYKPQSVNAFRRLLRAAERTLFSFLLPREAEHRIICGNASIRFLSGGIQSNIVGATASLLLEVDEAQDVNAEKFDHEVAPMAASTNAVTVFWGTAWDNATLLAREIRAGTRREAEGGARCVFCTDADRVGAEVPAYRTFVNGIIRRFGRSHPMVRTQYFCEEITDSAGMFTEERLQAIQGTHAPLEAPLPDRLYVFLIDVAGSDELTSDEKRKNGFSDSRDATALTICEVCEPEPGSSDGEPLWKAVARRSYRNVPQAQLRKLLGGELDRWQPGHVVIDHTGLGAGLSEFFSLRIPGRVTAVDITAGRKSYMAWEMLRHIPAGHWLEYRTEAEPAPSSFVPGRDPCEILTDPAALQRSFFRQLRACRMEPSASGSAQVRWGVPASLRDPADGRLIHDDLVLSAALFVFVYDILRWSAPAALPYAGNFDMDYEEDREF